MSGYLELTNFVGTVDSLTSYCNWEQELILYVEMSGDQTGERISEVI